MRTGGNNPLWLLGDHLGSTSKVANYDGLSVQSQQLYKPWGEKRYPIGAPTLPTTFRYTGQRSGTGLGPSGGEGLMFYNARWYDPAVGRFIQADSIIPDPGNSQAWDRYAYANNNPLNMVDPTGHGGTADKNGLGKGTSTPTPSPTLTVAPATTYVPVTTPVPTLLPTQTPAPGGQYTLPTTPTPPAPQPTYSVCTAPPPSTPSGSEIMAGYGNGVFDTATTYLQYLSNAYPAYRNVKGLIPNAPGEAVIAAGFQLYVDSDEDYSANQLAGRAILAGGEAYLTDLLSTGAGALAAGTTSPTGPGAAAAYSGASFLTNLAFEYRIWPWLNENVFYPGLNLGD
jgi:RHS repeat-associated protein